ncbi:SRPBCC family protein [Leucothrix arctica]|uniref:SRPBCC family protein n=1 Tax=Leucothrix arctica TaxID=1481894 RepID=A0A317CG54_9GAMM|nr:SRPBCC family protein [Leucothrix arctica]PWQ97367.1 hypothetical protein DKT75_07455 [Leucothrix arctica]
MNINVDIEIDRSLEVVWKDICDIEHSAQMISAITAFKLLEAPDDEGSLVGLKWTETRKVFGKEAEETLWITDYQPLSYYKTRAQNHGAIYISTMSVKELGENTLLTMSFESEANSLMVKVVSAVMGIFVKRAMVKMLDKDLHDIKQFVESNAEEVRRN